jgi:phage terminase large subunit-like protein
MAWALTARPDQRPPIENEADKDYLDWNIWLLMGGRGSGKTRAGAEWVRERALGLHDGAGDKPPLRIALVAPSLIEARSVMVEGVSGLLSLDWAEADRPVFEASKRLITWPNGSQAQIFSAEEPDSLRGPQFHAGWCDAQERLLDTLTHQMT